MKLLDRCFVFGHDYEHAVDLETFRVLGQLQMTHRMYRHCKRCNLWQIAKGSYANPRWDVCEEPEYYTIWGKPGKVRRAE